MKCCENFKVAAQTASFFLACMQVSTAMVLINVFQLIYVCDALWFEPSILSTMDITSEGFGYMLAFGDLTWVPFVYSIQARYLMDHTQVSLLPSRSLACLVCRCLYADSVPAVAPRLEALPL